MKKYIITIALLVVAAILIFPHRSHSVDKTPETAPKEEPEPIKTFKEELIEAELPERQRMIRSKIEEVALAYNVNPDKMYGTIAECENIPLDPDLQSYHVSNGVREQSYGLAQIHLPSNPEVSKEEAQDPEFAIEFMAQKFQDGKAERWTCYRKKYQI